MQNKLESRSFSFEPLTPVSFLDRSAEVYADQLAVVDGELRFTYKELHDRSLRLAHLLHSVGIEPADRVAVLAANGHVLLESHYGVPYAGAVLVALNTRLAVAELMYIVTHAGCKVLLCDLSYAVAGANIADGVGHEIQLVVADATYEHALSDGPGLRVPVEDERELLALNYTSGTTGRPKGVMYHHRGAYLQSLAMTKHFHLGSSSAYLWTLPMFHCNGWCFTWAVTAAAGVHVCLPEFSPGEAWRLLREYSVTHFCAAPTVLTMMAASGEAAPIEGRTVRVAVGGAPPSPSLITACESLGISVTHLYGLTETFGPAAICEWRRSWDHMPEATRTAKRARQGVGNVISQNLRVVDLQGEDVPRDGDAIGEVVVRGNNVMLGYYKDTVETQAAVSGGWFHTGDLAVMHADSYIEIRDRMKDLIISGGENISSVEVESALYSHPAVLEAAVVAMQDSHWGERPLAFVTLREGMWVGQAELQSHVRSQLAGFKVPDRIIFDTLPKTGTGKIQKFRLREIAQSLFE
jgi:fatty-acyl-CoA synthase